MRIPRANINHATCELAYVGGGKVTVSFVCLGENTGHSRPDPVLVVR